MLKIGKYRLEKELVTMSSSVDGSPSLEMLIQQFLIGFIVL